MTHADPIEDVPVVSVPGQVQEIEYYMSRQEVLLRSEGTGGKYLAMRVREMPPELAPPFHVHTREDEIWIVHGGLFRFWIGGESLDTAEVRDVGPGGVVYSPRNVAHTFQSIDGLGDVTILWSPGRVQDYFLNVGEIDVREDLDHVEELEKVGVHVLDRAPVDGR